MMSQLDCELRQLAVYYAEALAVHLTLSFSAGAVPILAALSGLGSPF